MSCHFVILLVMHFRDKYPHLTIPLHLTSSDLYEIFFFKVAEMVGQERAYNLHEFVNKSNTINRLSDIEFGKIGADFWKGPQ